MKDRIHWTWKRIVGTILGILGIGTLTSCYGVYEEYAYYDIYGNVKGAVNGTEQPLKGISVVLYEGNDATKSTLTDTDGWYEFHDLRMGSYKLRFTDIDGKENGGNFKAKDYDIALSYDYSYSPTLETNE